MHKLLLLPGFGFRASILKCIANEFADDDVSFMDLHIPLKGKDLLPNTTLIGWSLGGMMAAELCRIFPDKFTKLITINTNPKFVETIDWPGVTEKNINTFYQHAKKDLPSLLMYFQKLVNGNNKNMSIRRYLESHINEELVSLSHLDYLIKNDLRETYTGINIPALHIFGDEDTLVPRACAYQINQHFPQHRTHVIKKAGHIPFLTHKNEFMQVVQEFIHE